ncbi:MAG: cytochrome c oxidase assembly protein [Salaquimonas sp.]
MTQQTTDKKGSTSDIRIAVLCLSLVVGMGGLAYASVPLYQLFCQVTGYGGTTQAVENADGIAIIDRDITIRFDANISSDLAWEFKAIQRDVTIKLGEQKQIMYAAKNVTDEPLTGSATFNVTPQSAGAYFNKMQCFCFTETTLQPGEEMEMPVVFFVDPAMLEEYETKDIHTITLSYTFFPKEPTQKPLASLKEKNPEEVNGKL